MKEPEKPLKKKDQIKFDEEEALRLKAKFDEEDRPAREKAQQVEEANIAWDDIQAKFKVNYQLAQRLKKSIREKEQTTNKSSIKEFHVYEKALEQESSKKQKVDDDKETEELKQCMEIILDDRDDVTIEATPLSTKSLTIMLKSFDREDLEVLWSIVKARFKKTKLVNYIITFLHLNLKTMLEHHLEYNNILYYLLVEKMYPLTKHTLHQMFNDVKFQVDYECEMAFEFLRLFKKQLKEGYERIVRIKSLLKVTVVKVCVTATKHKLVLLVILMKNMLRTENMLVEVGKFTFPADFVILEMEEDSKVPLILGRPFLHTADAVIRVKQKQLNLGVGTERMIFNIDSTMKHSYSNDDTCFSIDVIDEILEEDFDALLDEGGEILHSIEGTILEEKLFAEFDEFMTMTTDENSESESNTEEPPFEKLTFNTDYKIKTSL
ncbi:reverse transcriptase domain-containing protein [Tanacetum coccineum]